MNMQKNNEYNFKYLLNISEQSDTSYELQRIMNAVDQHLSDYKQNHLFHIVPIVYTIVMTSGLAVFVYKVFS